MPFNREEVSRLLAECGRRCCICHRFCGVKMETDHITPSSEGGKDEIENAIPVCFDCHAEIKMYNPQHPRGRRFTQDELKHHKDRWLKFCQDQPQALMVASAADDNSGPLRGLIDELEFNLAVASQSQSSMHLECPFRHRQFDRAIEAGAIGLLDPAIKKEVLQTYVALDATNEKISAWVAEAGVHPDRRGHMLGDLHPRFQDCRTRIDSTLDQLNKLLNST
jgi:hypothetical protein